MYFWIVDDWHDWLRVLNLGLCLCCIILLGRRFAKNNSNWNTKTRDYWYALVMWSVAGVSFTVEALFNNLNMGSRALFLFFASAVTLKGILRKGTWGDVSR